MKITSMLPYSLSEVGPKLGGITKDKKGREGREGGVGNYYVEVKTQKYGHPIPPELSNNIKFSICQGRPFCHHDLLLRYTFLQL